MRKKVNKEEKEGGLFARLKLSEFWTYQRVFVEKENERRFTFNIKTWNI